MSGGRGFRVSLPEDVYYSARLPEMTSYLDGEKALFCVLGARGQQRRRSGGGGAENGCGSSSLLTSVLMHFSTRRACWNSMM